MEVEDSDQRNEGLDGGWGTEERVSLGIGGFTQSTAAREGGWLCLWRWHQNKAQAAPSQLTGPELIIINEQLGPVSWELHG